MLSNQVCSHPHTLFSTHTPPRQPPTTFTHTLCLITFLQRQVALTLAEETLEPWLIGNTDNPLLYDRTWGGVVIKNGACVCVHACVYMCVLHVCVCFSLCVSPCVCAQVCECVCASCVCVSMCMVPCVCRRSTHRMSHTPLPTTGLTDPYVNFGNTYYNDHHFQVRVQRSPTRWVESMGCVTGMRRLWLPCCLLTVCVCACVCAVRLLRLRGGRDRQARPWCVFPHTNTHGHLHRHPHRNPHTRAHTKGTTPKPRAAHMTHSLG
jgi:hypothetical protein